MDLKIYGYCVFCGYDWYAEDETEVCPECGMVGFSKREL